VAEGELPTAEELIAQGIKVSDAPKGIPLKVDEKGHAVVDVEAARAAGWKLDHTGWYRG
jgi:hypothetical protein